MRANLKKFLQIVLISSSTLLLFSCSCSNTAGIKGNGDLVAPEVSGVNPTKFKTKVPLNSFISASFTEEMDPDSITENTFYLKDANKNLISGTVYSKGKNTTFKPIVTLAEFTQYEVTLERRITDLNGNRLVQDFLWVFTTGNEIDSTPPEITGVLPSENETEVDVNTAVTVSFSEFIDLSSVDANSFRLEDNSGNPISGSLDINGSQVKFEPDDPLSHSTQYLLTINTDVQDVSGNNLEATFISYFTTGAEPDVTGPNIINVYPKPDAIAIATNSSIAITFDETLGSTATDSANLTVTDANNQDVDGVLTSRDNVLVFTPSLSLATSTQYTVTVNNAVADTKGNTMESNFSWQFTTGDGADSTPPVISYVMPEINAANVANNNAITVTFSEAIDPKTLGITKFTVQADGNFLDGSITYTGTTAIFKPNNVMANNTVHQVTIGSGVSDLSGNLSTESFTWSFVTGTVRDSDIPRVSSVFPTDGATDFAINSAVIVRFTEAMNPATLTPKSFYLQDNIGNIIEGYIVTLGASSSFRPLSSLSFSEQYTAIITTQAEDLADNTMAEEYRWSFTTASAEDTTSPSVVSTVPASASQQAAVNRGIIVSFNEVVDPESVNQASFYLTDTLGTLIPGTISVTEETATYQPNDNLDFTKTYVATLLTSVTDLAGNPLNKVFSWNFTTSSQPDTLAPSVISTTPMENGLSTVNHRITIQFSEAMKTSSISSASISLTDLNANEVDITVNVAEQNAYITPVNDLSFDTNYIITISTDVKDLANNNMANDFVLNFKTSLHPDLAPPFVVSTTPHDGENDVLITLNPSVLFSEAINCSLVTNNHFQILNASVPVTGNMSCNNDILTFTPDSALPTQTTYTLQLTTDIVDLAGDNLETNYQSTFTTAAWTQQTGTVVSEQTFAVTADTNGNLISTGFTMGSFGNLNNGNADIYVTKHNKNSLLLWAKQFGSSNDDFATSVISDTSGNIYISGYTYGDLAGTSNGNSDLFVIKLDENGSLLWQKQYGTTEDDAANGIHIDAAGNIIIAAYSFTDFDGNTSSGQHDIVLLKLDSDGNKLWSQQYGSLENDIPNAITSDASNNIYIAGYSLGDLDGNTNQGDSDGFISKLDSSGTILWTSTLGSFLTDAAQSLALDSSNNIILAGYTLGDLQGETNLGSSDQFIAKLDNNGTLSWYRQLGTVLDDRAYDVVTTGDDSIIVTGYTAGDMQGTNNGNFDIVTLKLDATGNTIWTSQLGSDQDDVAFTLSLDGAENIYLGGYTVGSLDNIVNLGQQDMVLIKLDSSGVKQ